MTRFPLWLTRVRRENLRPRPQSAARFMRTSEVSTRVTCVFTQIYVLCQESRGTTSRPSCRTRNGTCPSQPRPAPRAPPRRRIFTAPLLGRDAGSSGTGRDLCGFCAGAGSEPAIPDDAVPKHGFYLHIFTWLSRRNRLRGLGSTIGNHMRVRVPPSAPNLSRSIKASFRSLKQRF